MQCTTPCVYEGLTATFAVQCPYDDGAPERRVCEFKNLLMFQGRLFYIYTGMLLPNQLLTHSYLLHPCNLRCHKADMALCTTQRVSVQY